MFEQVELSDETVHDHATCVSLPSVVVTSTQDDGCWSYVGEVSTVMGRSQGLNLGLGCAFPGIAEHELGHVIGMLHEQARLDRNRFVTVHRENVDPDVFAANFGQDTNAYVETTYDILSLMHYDAHAFSINGEATIEPVRPRLRQFLGQRVGFSQLDVEHMARMYGCSDTATAETPNKNLSVWMAHVLTTNFERNLTDCVDSTPTVSENVTENSTCPDLLYRCADADVQEQCPLTCFVCDPTDESASKATERSRGNVRNGLSCLSFAVTFLTWDLLFSRSV